MSFQNLYYIASHEQHQRESSQSKEGLHPDRQHAFSQNDSSALQAAQLLLFEAGQGHSQQTAPSGAATGSHDAQPNPIWIEDVESNSQVRISGGWPSCLKHLAEKTRKSHVHRPGIPSPPEASVCCCQPLTYATCLCFFTQLWGSMTSLAFLRWESIAHLCLISAAYLMRPAASVRASDRQVNHLHQCVSSWWLWP